MTEEEIIKHFRLGPDSRVKFKGDPQQYWIKNISPDRKNVFIHINGAQTYRKLIKNIVQVDNKKLNIKETIKKVVKELKEGVWALDRAKIPEIIKEIEVLKKKAYNIIGDDQFFDGLDSAISRAEHFMDEKSKKDDVPGHPNIKEKLNENKSCSCKHK